MEEKTYIVRKFGKYSVHVVLSAKDYSEGDKIIVLPSTRVTEAFTPEQLKIIQNMIAVDRGKKIE